MFTRDRYIQTGSCRCVPRIRGESASVTCWLCGRHVSVRPDLDAKSSVFLAVLLDRGVDGYSRSASGSSQKGRFAGRWGDFLPSTRRAESFIMTMLTSTKRREKHVCAN